MTPMRMTLAAVLALGLGSAPLIATEIGVVAATNTQIEGTPPANPTRVLAVSDRLNLNERVVSSAVGSGQFLFDDQTSLTIAPNTDIVLDEYVYDPARDAGKIAMSFNKGVMRFIGGRISKTTDATVTTPVATIGIRGGIALLQMQSPSELKVIHVAGEYSQIIKGDRVLTLTRTNAVATVDGNGDPVYRGVATSAEVGELYEAVQGEGDGGARTASEIAAASGVNTLAGIGDDASAANLPPIATDGSSPEDVQELDSNFNIAGIDPGLQALRFQDEGFIRDNAGNVISFSVGSQGLIRGQLLWDNSSDLDLHLVLPNGQGEVSSLNPEIIFNDGGAFARLDVENFGDVVSLGESTRAEHIVVTGDDIPSGTYTFFVQNFTANGNAVTDFSLLVTGDGAQTSTTQTGSLADGALSSEVEVDSAGGAFGTGDSLNQGTAAPGI